MTRGKMIWGVKEIPTSKHLTWISFIRRRFDSPISTYPRHALQLEGSIMTGRHTNRINVFHTISGRSMLFEDEVLLSQVLAPKWIYQWDVW